MAKNIAKNFNRLSTAHERYKQTDRQTDGRQHNSEREREFTYAKSNSTECLNVGAIFKIIVCL